jgi:hypothetical protein
MSAKPLKMASRVNRVPRPEEAVRIELFHDITVENRRLYRLPPHRRYHRTSPVPGARLGGVRYRITVMDPAATERIPGRDSGRS